MKTQQKQLKIALLYCQHCVAEQADIAAVKEHQAPSIHTAMMPCSSKVQVSNILSILDKEAEGVEVIACPEKGCRFLVGNCRAEKRVASARELLGRISVGAESVGITRGTNLSHQDLISIAKTRSEKIQQQMNQGEQQ